MLSVEKMSEFVNPFSAGPDPRVIASLFNSGETITDTGLRLLPRGEIALYISQSSAAMGIVCRRCSGFAIFLRPWSRCYHCGDLLLVAAHPPLPSQVMKVDWVRGYATVEETESTTAAADSSVSSSADIDPTLREANAPASFTATAVEVSVPTATAHHESSAAITGLDQVVPVAPVIPEEIRVPATTATTGEAATESCQPSVTICRDRHARSSRGRGKSRSRVLPYRCLKLVSQTGIENVQEK